MTALAGEQYKVIFLQETNAKRPREIPGYKRFYTTPGPASGSSTSHGLATYVHRSLASRRAAEDRHLCKEAEAISVDVITHTGEHIELVNNYISPSARPKSFDLEQFENKNALIAGDLNARIDWDNTASARGDEASRRGKLLKQAITRHPTILSINRDAGWTNQYTGREEQVSYSQIDHMFITTQLSCKYDVKDTQTVTPLTAGKNFHKMLTTKVDIPMATDRDSFEPAYKWRSWDTDAYKHTTENKFRELLNSPEYMRMNATERYKAFQDIVGEAVEQTCPKTKWCSSPWKSFFWGPRCEDAKKKYKDALTKGIGNAEETRLELAQIVEEEKNLAWSKVFEEIDLARNPHEGWKTINNIKTGGKIIRQNVQTSQAETDDLANEFKDRSNPNKVLTDQIRLTLAGNLPERRNRINTAKNTRNDSQDRPLDYEVLARYLDKSPSKSSTGQDKISYAMMHHLGLTGRQVLYDIIQASWEEGALPASWKHAEIVPIPKKDGTKRPISLLEVVGKLAERLVKARLDEHLPEPPPTLFGFERERGCQDALMALREFSEPSRSPKLVKAVIYVDFEKAFEIADKSVILSALAELNIQGKLLTWLEDFLSNRTAHVKNKKYRSAAFECLAGTPQGSILSPTLFNIIMRKLVTMLNEGKLTRTPDQWLPLATLLKILSYADDLALCFEVKKFMCIIEARKIMRFLERACVFLGLKINASKTKWQIFHHDGKQSSHRNLGKHYYPPPRLCRQINQPAVYQGPALALSDGSPIEKVTSFPYLGVTFQSNRGFRQNCVIRHEKAKGSLGILRTAVNDGKGISTRAALHFATCSVGMKVNYGAAAVCEADFEKSSGLVFERNPVLRTDLRRRSPVEHSLSLIDGRFCNAVRTALAVHNRVPTEVIFLETGLFPLPTLRQIAALKSVLKAIYTCRPHALDPHLRAYFESVDRDNHILSYLSRLVKHLKGMGVTLLDKAGRREIKHPRIKCDLNIVKSFSGKKEDQDPALVRTLTLEYISATSTEDDIVIYTDGSMDPTSGRSGAAALARHEGSTIFQWKTRTRDWASSTETELIALHGAFDNSLSFLDNHINNGLAREEPNNLPRKVVLYTDSQAAIQILSNDENDEHIELLHGIKMKSEELLETINQVEIHWIPSHIGISGNETVDRMAKEASHSDGPIYNPYHGVAPKQHFIRQIKLSRERAFKDFARNKLETRPSLIRNWYRLVNPDLKPYTHPPNLTRPMEQVITECRLMQFAICNQCGIQHSCSYCGAPASSTHYLLECWKSRGLVKRLMGISPPIQHTPIASVRNEEQQKQLQLQLDTIAASAIRSASHTPENLLNCVKRVPISACCSELACPAEGHRVVHTKFHSNLICDFMGAE